MYLTVKVYQNNRAMMALDCSPDPSWNISVKLFQNLSSCLRVKSFEVLPIFSSVATMFSGAK